MVRKRIFCGEIRSIEKNGNTPWLPPHNQFYVYKVFLFEAWKQFYIMSESTEFSFIRYPIFPRRHTHFYQWSIFVLYFLFSVPCLACRTTKQWRHYWQWKYLLRHKVETPYLNTFFVQNSVPEYDFCSGVIGGQLTELQHKADNPVTCLINARIYRSSVFSAANSLTMVESEKFGRIQEFLTGLYKFLAG